MTTVNENDTKRFLIRVSEDIPSVEECYAFVADGSPGCGAVASFVGITRDNFRGQKVRMLSYEGYIPMAEKELLKLCRDAVTEYPSVHRIAAVHILGECPIGTASVILTCSSPHRTEAIRCSEYLIDQLKGRIPVWKLEVYEGDDQSVWKENIEWRQGRKERVMARQEDS